MRRDDDDCDEMSDGHEDEPELGNVVRLNFGHMPDDEWVDLATRLAKLSPDDFMAMIIAVRMTRRARVIPSPPYPGDDQPKLTLVK